MSVRPPLSPAEVELLRERARSTTPAQRLAWLEAAQRFEAEVRAARVAAGLPTSPRDWEAQVRCFEDSGAGSFGFATKVRP